MNESRMVRTGDAGCGIDIDYLRRAAREACSRSRAPPATPTTSCATAAERARSGSASSYELTRRGAIRACLRGDTAGRRAGRRRAPRHARRPGEGAEGERPARARADRQLVGALRRRRAHDDLLREGRLPRHHPAAQGVRATPSTTRSTRSPSAGTTSSCASTPTPRLAQDSLATRHRHRRHRRDRPAAGVPRQRLHRLAPPRQQGGLRVHAGGAAGACSAKPRTPPVDVHWLFTIAEEVGHGAASILLARRRLAGGGRQRHHGRRAELVRVRRDHRDGRP